MPTSDPMASQTSRRSCAPRSYRARLRSSRSPDPIPEDEEEIPPLVAAAITALEGGEQDRSCVSTIIFEKSNLPLFFSKTRPARESFFFQYNNPKQSHGSSAASITFARTPHRTHGWFSNRRISLVQSRSPCVPARRKKWKKVLLLNLSMDDKCSACTSQR